MLISFYLSGFIDFIVDPSFQVMGDMLDKIIIPLKQKQNGTGGSEKKTTRKTASITSLDSTDSDDSTAQVDQSTGGLSTFTPLNLITTSG